MNNSYLDGRVSAREAAAALGVPRRKVYKLAQTGRLAAERIGRRIFFEQVVLQRFGAELTHVLPKHPPVEAGEPAHQSSPDSTATNAPTSPETSAPTHGTQVTSHQRLGQREFSIPDRSKLGPRIVIFSGFDFTA